jgi:hypothetical protein
MKYFFLLLFLASCAVVPPQANDTQNPFMDNALFCNVDADCTCGGVDKQTRDCFIGNKLFQSMYVDITQSCPDFCTGIGGHFGIKCVDHVCEQVEREMFACTEEAKMCPDGSAVGRVGPDCEFEPCPDEGKTIRFRDVMWESFLPPGEDPYTELTNEVLAVSPGDEFGEGEYMSAFKVIEVNDDGVKIEVDAEALVVCNMPISEPDMGKEWLVTSEELCFRTRSDDGGHDYFISLEESRCKKDSDCVFDSCCHPKGCVAKDQAPLCDAIACTENCEPGSLDCGGSCACVDGECVGQNYFG